jgi:hypothetical protein
VEEEEREAVETAKVVETAGVETEFTLRMIA